MSISLPAHSQPKFIRSGPVDFEKEKIEEYSVFVALCRRPGSDEVSYLTTLQAIHTCILSLFSLPKISRQPLRRGSNCALPRQLGR